MEPTDRLKQIQKIVKKVKEKVFAKRFLENKLLYETMAVKSHRVMFGNN